MSNEEPTIEGDEEALEEAPAADPESVEAEIERAAASLEGVTDPFADGADPAADGESEPAESGDNGSGGVESGGDESGVGPSSGNDTQPAESAGVDTDRTDPDDETITLGGDAGASDEEPTESADDEMVTVEAHISPVQREVWQRQADQAKLTMSEYIRRMVEAGRMSVQMELAEQMEADGQERAHTSATDEDELRDQILFLLERETVLSWEELIEKLSRNFEESVGEVLEALQDEDRVRHSGFRGGYVLLESDDD